MKTCISNKSHNYRGRRVKHLQKKQDFKARTSLFCNGVGTIYGYPLGSCKVEQKVVYECV